MIRSDIKEALDLWGDKGVLPGDFLQAILRNDLTEAQGRADEYNKLTLDNIVSHVYNELPSECWGSKDKVESWAKHKMKENTKVKDTGKPKIYCFSNGGTPGLLSAVAIAEDGNVLAGHGCSHESFIPIDLGMISDSHYNHEKYKKHYPNGYQMEFVEYDKISSHQELQKAFKLNKELKEENEKKDKV